MTPHRSRFPSRLACLALALAALPVAAHAGRLPAGQAAVESVMDHIRSADCKGAVGALNAGLAENHPEVALLAGSMYDNGVCVRRDWQRAVQFYVQAHDGGHAGAVYRLAAGFAAPENGPDIAAALWWASRIRPAVMEACAVTGAAADDPDLFVAALNAWPQKRLAHCNYIVGVMSTLAGEMRYPDRPLSFAVGADIEMRFVPAVPRMDLRPTGSTEFTMLGIVDGNEQNERYSKRMTAAFLDTVRALSERAIKRYPQPPGIHPESQAVMRFTFTITQH
jgi:hypothetical protein